MAAGGVELLDAFAQVEAVELACRLKERRGASHGGVVEDQIGAGVLQVKIGPDIVTACPGDIGSQGGQPGSDGVRDNNDFVVFIDYFFGHDALADVGAQGGVAGQDGVWDNNDFVVFIDQFFTAC